MGSEVRIDGEDGLDDISAGAADAPGVGALAAQGLTLREFGQRGIPPSTLSWWRQVFRCAGEEKMNRAPAENAVVFTEVPQPAKLPRTASVLEIVLHSGHMVRVPPGADSDTLQRVLQALQTTC